MDTLLDIRFWSAGAGAVLGDQTSMHIFRSLLDRGILTSSDYAEAERLMREIYNPSVGTLFSDLALT